MAGTKPGIEVEGGPQLRRAFKKLGDRADDLKPLHKSAAELVERRAEDLAPVLTGRLRQSVKSRASKTRAAVTAGGRGIPYVGPIHFGWRARNIEPQPFLYDALDQRRGEVAKRYADGVAAMVRRFDAEAPD